MELKFYALSKDSRMTTGIFVQGIILLSERKY